MTEVSQEAREAEVTVTQADRNAAADLIETYWAGLGENHDTMRRLAQSYRDGLTQGVWAEAFARHRHQAERETLARMEPVAWMYEREGQLKTPLIERAQHMTEYGWTETPLFALPPAPEAGQ